MKSTLLFAIPVLFLLFFAGCAEKDTPPQAHDGVDAAPAPEPSTPRVGGDKDEHGCIGSAGYQWCPSTGKCQRMWEEYCEEYADQYRTPEEVAAQQEERNTVEGVISMAEEHLQALSAYTSQNGRNIDLIYAREGSCTTCWDLELSYEHDDPASSGKVMRSFMQIQVEDGKVVSYGPGQESVAVE